MNFTILLCNIFIFDNIDLVYFSKSSSESDGQGRHLQFILRFSPPAYCHNIWGYVPQIEKHSASNGRLKIVFKKQGRNRSRHPPFPQEVSLV